MRISTTARYALAASAAAAILAGCSSGSPSSFGPSAVTANNVVQESVNARGQAAVTHYYLIDLGTLGGKISFGNSINDRGWISGTSYLRGNTIFHAVLWRAGRKTDLGTLGGPNSAILYPIKNDRGKLAGISEVSTLDPLNENFCGYGTGDICLGFSWRNGIMTPLPTLGGNNAQATGANNRGDVIGVAETSTTDSSCQMPQQLIYNGVIWQPKGTPTALPPYSGDTVSIAFAINNSAQVVGTSGGCASVLSTPTTVHAVLWQSGSTNDLGTLGGSENNVAFAINNRGHVSGQSSLAGNTTSHAFLWQSGVMSDLGTLPGDVSSAAFGMNDKDQIVGTSCDSSSNCRGFIWQNGSMTDLNALVPPSAKLYVLSGSDINDRGAIAATAIDMKKGALRAVALLPGNNPLALRTEASSPRLVLPQNLRTQRQIGGRVRPIGP